MRILHIINSLGAGGAEKLIDDMIPIMKRHSNIEVHVLLLNDRNLFFGNKLKENGVEVSVSPANSIYSLWNILHIRNVVLSGQYDIIHSHLFPASYFTSIAARLARSRVKLITTEHSTHNKRRGKPILRPIERFIYSTYSKIVSISIDTQVNLIEWLTPSQRHIGKFEVIANGIDLDHFAHAQPYRKSELFLGFTEDTRLLCMVGSFTDAKDQKTVIKVLRGLPDNVSLVLVGDGPLREESELLAHELGVSGRTIFLGLRDDVPRILKTVDIVIHSSIWEGFGIAALEAMACGKPVIATSVPGLREVVEGAGVLFRQGDVDELGFKIRELINDQAKYTLTCNRCLRRSASYDIAVTAKNYLALYHSLIAQ